MNRSILFAAAFTAVTTAGIAGAGAIETYELGGSALGTPSVVWYKPGGSDAVAVFVRGTDGHMYAQVGDGQGAGWTGWAPIGDLLLKSDPACVATSGSVIDCVAVGPNNNVFHIRHNAKSFTWSEWENLGGFATGAPGIARTLADNSAIMLNVFVSGPESLLFLNAFDGDSWSDWQNLEVKVGGTVTCTNILVVGAHCYDTSSGSPVQYSDVTRTSGSDILVADWQGQIAGTVSPVVTGKAADTLYLFGNGPGKRLWVKSWHGDFSEWKNLSVAIANSSPGCALRAVGGNVWCGIIEDNAVKMIMVEANDL